MKLIRITSILMTLVLASVGRHAFAQPEITVDKIARGWEDRQKRITAGRIEWTDLDTIPKGTISDLIARATKGKPKPTGIAPGEIVPPSDTTVEVPQSFHFHGSRIRYSREESQWSSEQHGFVPEPTTYVFDGTIGKYLSSAPSAHYCFASVEIGRSLRSG